MLRPNNISLHFKHALIFGVPFTHLSFAFCSCYFSLQFKLLGSISNAASAFNSAILAFSSSSFNFVDDLELLLDILLADDLEVLDFLLLLHLEPFAVFCAAFFNQLCTLCLKLNTSWSRSSNQFPSGC